MRIQAMLCFFLALLFACCLPPACADAGPAALRIACIMRGGSQYWDNVARGIDAEAERCGAVVLYLYIAGVENALSWEQAAHIATLSGCQVILTSYNNDAAYLARLEAARAEGCRIVFMDNDGPEELRDCYVGVDTLAAGAALAEDMLRHLRPGDAALLCTSPHFTGNQNQDLLRQGIEGVFADSGHELRFFSDTLNVDQYRQTELDDYLTGHPEVCGIFSLSQLQTRGYVSLSAGTAWGTRVHICGMDYQESVRPAIESGALSLLEKNSYSLGVTSCRTAAHLAAGEALADDCVYVRFLILDADNLSDYLSEVD